jgi:dynein intermediate chain
MQYHPMSTRYTRDLLLSASVDWTIKLWNLNASESSLLVMQQPTYEYVSDVKWSPSHPTLFGTTDSGGELALWNLSQSVQEPVVPAFKVSSHGLTKLAWKSDSRHILVGDTAGIVSLVSVPDEISKPRGDEERFLASLRGMNPSARPASAAFDNSVLESKSSA